MAPRGLYQRGLSQAERWALHRSELIRATAEMLNERQTPSVQSIVRRAGKGRNTFYAHFAGLEQATRAVESSAALLVAGRVDGALRTVVAPRERLRGVIAAWLSAASDSPSWWGRFCRRLRARARRCSPASTCAGRWKRRGAPASSQAPSTKPACLRRWAVFTHWYACASRGAPLQTPSSGSRWKCCCGCSADRGPFPSDLTGATVRQ